MEGGEGRTAYALGPSDVSGRFKVAYYESDLEKQLEDEWNAERKGGRP